MSEKVLGKLQARKQKADPPASTERDQEFYYASQWDLVWWRFRQHKLALVAGILLVGLYAMAITADFIKPYGAWQRFSDAAQAPPTRIHFTRPGEGLQWPFVHRVERRIDEETFRWSYEEITAVKYPLKFFARGHAYKFLGFIRTDIHLFGVDEEAGIWLFGLDLRSAR